MIPDRNFLRRCAHNNNLNLPQELEDWLLVHFEDLLSLPEEAKDTKRIRP